MKETKLQCGWEDDCKAKNCHKCPRKYKMVLEVTEAEVCCVEDCATCDLPQWEKDNKEAYDLMQEVMLDLMRKMFKEETKNEEM